MAEHELLTVTEIYDPDVQRATLHDVTGFARAMRRAGAFDDPEGPLDVIENPTKWRREFELWSVLLRPLEGEPTWETFCELIWKGDGAVREYLAEREEART